MHPYTGLPGYDEFGYYRFTCPENGVDKYSQDTGRLKSISLRVYLTRISAIQLSYANYQSKWFQTCIPRAREVTVKLIIPDVPIKQVGLRVYKAKQISKQGYCGIQLIDVDGNLVANKRFDPDIEIEEGEICPSGRQQAEWQMQTISSSDEFMGFHCEIEHKAGLFRRMGVITKRRQTN